MQCITSALFAIWTRLPGQNKPLPILPKEIIGLILQNLSPIESEKARGVSREWKTITDYHFNPKRWIEKGFNNQLDTKNLLWLILILIRNRKSSKRDEAIVRLCRKISKRHILESNIHKVPATVKMIIGTGKSTHFSRIVLKTCFPLKVPKCIEEASHTNDFALFMVGLQQYAFSHNSISKILQASEKGIASSSHFIYANYDELPLKNSWEYYALKACEQGSELTPIYIANCIFFNLEIRIKYLRRALHTNRKIVQLKLAFLLLSKDRSLCTEEERKEALELLKSAARRGSAKAQKKLSELQEAHG